MQWYRYWAICEYSGVLTYSPQTCENLSVLEKEILKEGGITDWVHSRPSMFYFSKLYCFLYCLFALFLFLNSFFTFTSRNIICQVFDPLNLLLYRLSPRSFAIQRTVVCVYWLQSICRKKKEDGIRWINRAVMFNIFWCGKTETKQNWKTTTKGK